MVIMSILCPYNLYQKQINSMNEKYAYPSTYIFNPFTNIFAPFPPSSSYFIHFLSPKLYTPS